MSRQQYRFVTGNVGLRRQYIEALRPGGARRRFEGEGGNAAFSHLGDDVVVERIEHAHQYGAALDLGQFAIVGSHNFQNKLCTKRIGSAANSGACCFIGTVRNAGVDAGAALDGDLMPLTNQFLDGFRGCSNPCFARLRFEWNTNVHVKSPA
ncbi:hypothetical protein D3C79_782990 [compost metagenome]